MDEIFRQLGDLVLGSVPTMVIFLILVAAYAGLVNTPLHRTLAARRALTVGAVEKAHASIALAEAKAQEYEARLRAARLEIFGRREALVKQWNQAGDLALLEAKEAAKLRVGQARAEMEKQTEQARTQIGSGIDGLAGQILEAILPVGAR